VGSRSKEVWRIGAKRSEGFVLVRTTNGESRSDSRVASEKV